MLYPIYQIYRTITCFTSGNFVISHMNFLHYLYTKGETTLNYRLNGRLLIVTPIWLFFLFFSGGLLNVDNSFLFILVALCWWGTLYGISYIILPPKKVKLKTWIRKYKSMTSFWAYLYFFSPLIILWIVTSIGFLSSSPD